MRTFIPFVLGDHGLSETGIFEGFAKTKQLLSFFDKQKA